MDIVMLQVAAANMDPTTFIITLLGKFQLINWADQAFDASEDDNIRQITILVFKKSSAHYKNIRLIEYFFSG